MSTQPEDTRNGTIRERHKSAPYLRLKKGKMTSKCQVFFYSTPKKPKTGTLWDFSTFLSQNINKSERGPFEVIKLFSRKVSHCRKTGKGDHLEFLTSILSQNIKKLKGGPFGGKKLFEKCPTMPKKNWKGAL